MFSLFGPKTTLDLYESGVKSYRKGRSQDAIEKLSEAIKKESAKSDPDKRLLSNMYCLRGEIYLSVGVALLSQSDFTYALGFNVMNENALNNMGIWFSIERFSTPDYKRSIEYFDKAIAIKPGRMDIRLNKACVKIQSGDRTGCDDLRKLDAEGYATAKVALEKLCGA